jgi:endonuclease/exonuclease/phosphatase family metal-dependent hydrolase
VKILTWNVQWFKGLDEVVDIKRVIEHARSMADFDAICMQEVAVNYRALTRETEPDQIKTLRALLPGFEVVFSPAVDELSPCGGFRRQFGNVVASRVPIRQIQHFALPHPPAASSEPTPSMPRIALDCTLQAPWGPVRLMTTHLEYYNEAARHAQARALRELHLQSCALAAQQPKPQPGSPYELKPHTMDALLCGDFNFEHDSPEHASIIEPGQSAAWVNSWDLLHPGKPYPATFRIFDRTYGPEPVGCDFFFVSPSLGRRVQELVVDQQTQASDHQPVVITLRD